PEPDAEEAGAGRDVARLEGVVGALVGLAEAAAAVLDRAGDPAEAGVVAGRPPGLGLHDLGLLRLAVDLFEEGHVVLALTPAEGLVRRRLQLGGGVEEGAGLLGELVDCGLVRHRWVPSESLQLDRPVKLAPDAEVRASAARGARGLVAGNLMAYIRT